MKRSEVRNVYKRDSFLMANINVLCKQRIKNWYLFFLKMPGRISQSRFSHIDSPVQYDLIAFNKSNQLAIKCTVVRGSVGKRLVYVN